MGEAIGEHADGEVVIEPELAGDLVLILFHVGSWFGLDLADILGDCAAAICLLGENLRRFFIVGDLLRASFCLGTMIFDDFLGFFPALVGFVLFLRGHFGALHMLRGLTALDADSCSFDGKVRIAFMPVFAFPVAGFVFFRDVLDIRLDSVGVLLELLCLLAFLLRMQRGESGLEFVSTGFLVELVHIAPFGGVVR